MQTTPPDSLSLKFQDPEDCSASKCKTFVGMERNGGNKEYLNFYLEGEASAWVAVGFSKTESMVRGAERSMQLCADLCLFLLSFFFLQFSAEVFGCAVSTDGKVQVLDTWNVGPPEKNNVAGAEHGATLYPFNASNHNGRISCRYRCNRSLLLMLLLRGGGRRRICHCFL